MRTSRVAAVGVSALLAVTALTSSGAIGSTHSSTTTQRAGRFHHPRQNLYFPLRPGTVTRYRGTDEGEHFVERLVVTARHKRIQGVRTRVVSDVLRRVDGTLAEKTEDWYADDDAGNVWYFGERTATFDEHGALESREGSWRAGRHGAVRGLIMPAHPRPTRAYRQELDRGNAEDQAWIVQRGAHVRTPYRSFFHAIRTFEWTRLEPGVVSVKLYAPHIGIVSERDLAGGNERFVLTSVAHR
jgi:hypothetical protein